MKVVKLGDKIVYKCKKCGAELEIEHDDWINRQVDHFSSETYVECPCCGEKILKNSVIDNINNSYVKPNNKR